MVSWENFRNFATAVAEATAKAESEATAKAESEATANAESEATAKVSTDNDFATGSGTIVLTNSGIDRCSLD